MLTTKTKVMKRIALIFALLFTFSSAFISCRETEREDEVEVRDDMNEVGEDIEEAGEDIEEEID